jgi:hypothetical protein
VDRSDWRFAFYSAAQVLVTLGCVLLTMICVTQLIELFSGRPVAFVAALPLVALQVTLNTVLNEHLQKLHAGGNK